MAEIIKFPESNHVFKGEKCLDLPVHVYENQGSQVMLSCWKLTEHELLEVQRTGRIWLHVWGSQPPVYVGGHRPFEAKPVDN